ncbi:hypothetical protein SY88_22160 [Clostridiales bacterium PH28_bin88]|nr:hypothetical protein SY88_22160 [Clostridiales bacterium PH28_bin88]
MFYRFAKGLFRLFFDYVCHWQVVGRENQPLEGPVVVICNHVSNWDPIALGVSLDRQVCYMAKQELFRVPVLGTLIKWLGAFPVKRGGGDRGALRAAQETLNQGKMIGMFPEGTRSKNGELLPFKPGAAVLAVRTGAPILPVALVGIKSIWYRGWFRPFKVLIGKPIPVEKPETVQSEMVNELSARAQQAVADLLQQG